MNKFRINCIYFLFYLGTWISKTLFPILWEAKGKLGLYTLSYSSMALAGTCSLFLPLLMNRLHFIPYGILGVGFFSSGLIFRAFPSNATFAILSGILCGIGSSLLILVFKDLVATYEEPKRSQLICSNVTYSKVAQIVGSFCAGYFVYLVSFFLDSSIEHVLILSAIPILLIGWLLPIARASTCKNQQQFSIFELISHNPKHIFKVVFTIFLAGLYQASLMPLIPLYLKEAGFTIHTIGFLLSLGSAIGIVFNSVLNRSITPIIAGKGYFIISVFSSISLIGYLWRFSSFFIALSALFYIALRIVGSTFSNIIEMNLVERKYAFSLFGVLSTTFLIGDILGGVISMYVFSNRHCWFIIYMVAFLTLLNGFLYMHALYRARSETQPNENVN